ncbi:MAG: Chaperone protein DnaK [Chloroflexi bacterium]|nr:Chaperone protein DnaK [Chloroflexota bacterium]
MKSGKQITLFALDCGATNWRLYRVGYRLHGNLVRIKGEPQPSPLTSFSERKLPAILTLNPEGTAIENFGEVAQVQLEDETSRDRVREYFKPCLGAHLESDPLPHQKRYTHAQAVRYTRALLEVIVEQIRDEKWRASAFDEGVRFAFAYPVHWGHDHEGAILEDFKSLVLGCFPEDFHPNVRFVTEPEGAILSLKRQGLLGGATGNGVTLIIDVGGSTTDIVAGKVDPRSGELLYLGRYGEPFGGGLYDAEMANYLADALSIPPSTLAEDPSSLVILRTYGQRLKESLSRQLLQVETASTNSIAQRMITLVTQDKQIYRKLIKIDRDTFDSITHHLHQTFQDLIAQAIRTIGLQDDEIGQVALVGGGVQLFSIVQFLRERFGEEKVVLADNPDEIVVRGVGLEFGISMGTFQPGASLVIEPPAAEGIPSEDKDRPESVWQLLSEEGQVYALDGNEMQVGRGKESHIWLKSDRVSRVHAEFRQTGDTLEVADLGSTNGTFVNEERLEEKQPCSLQHGDRIRFGNQTLTVGRVMSEE